MVRAAGAIAAELGWVLHRGVQVGRRHPGECLVASAALWLTWPLIPATWAVGAAALLVGLRMWARWAPLGFHRWVLLPVRGLTARQRLRRSWPLVALACGLGVTEPSQRAERPGTAVPRVLRATSDGVQAELRLKLVRGQTVDDIERAAEAVRTAFAASHVRTERQGADEARLIFTLGDTLATPFRATVPAMSTEDAPDRVPMGRLEDGSTWTLPVGPHTLVAGCSGSGKGSLFWSFAFGLAPCVRAGLTRLHGIDLKGGMEILMGDGLFTTRATTAAEGVSSLELLVKQMQDRTRRYAGKVRSHVATIDEPLHVVMIDELAALTAYQPERELQRRAEMAINLLCSQGRAVGFMVFGCLQDPRKEVIPSRGLFTQMVGLRLKDVSETLMVLGESAVTSGANCHRITRETPGVGFVVPEDGGPPVKVRAGFASDAAIRAAAAEFATPTREELPELEPRESTPRPRRPKAEAHRGES